jgi:hypothetical protein
VATPSSVTPGTVPGAGPGAAAPTLQDPPPGTTTAAGGASGGSGSAGGSTGSLPNLVARGLQNAQDVAQQAGFTRLTSHDALGRGRHQVLDRDWKVCFQSPAPGAHAESVTVDLGTVRTSEKCPGADHGVSALHPATDVMPNLRGKSLSVAAQLLGRDSTVTWRDASGKDRLIVVGSDWQVCRQKPAAGAAYNGVPVTLSAVKFGERC